MAATTTLLGLVTPTQGTLSGTWGDTVNYGITDYVDIAIAGTLSFADDGAITLANTLGSASGNGITSTTAQYMVIRITGTQTVTKVITGPSYSKLYMVDHAGATSAVTFKAAGQTGVTVAVGEKCFVYYNGTDYVKIATSTAGTGSVTSVAVSGGTTGLTTSGGPITTSGTITLAGTVATTNGGTGLTSFTSGGVVYASSSSALATGSAFVFNGANLGLGVTPGAWDGAFKAFQFGDRASISQDNSTTYVSNNYVRSDNFRYLVTATASDYYQDSGKHVWRTAPSGTAGNVIAFTQAMTLDASGRLGIGSTSPAELLHLSSGSNTRARIETTDTGSVTVTQYKNAAGETHTIGSETSAGNAGFGGSSAYAFCMYAGGTTRDICFGTNGAERARITSGGNVLVGGTAARGTTAGTAHLDLFNGTAPAGTLTNGISLYSDSGDLKFMNAAGDAFDVGYRNIPQNSQSAAYTLVLADAGKHIFHPVGDNNARTFTIPANSSVAYPVGTAITFINMAVANVTIAITSDTMYLSSAGTTGSRTLAQYGSATAIKITSTNWLISGSGLT
jgi:hypothetical protein